ncbi:hypothetical protein [Nonomuraea sp. NPDC050783]|uniref:hypothetical protein n=1 Tax=Nonomuraea sp. NPDC050783 TaxID=3154634 RepID=UPI003464E999
MKALAAAGRALGYLSLAAWLRRLRELRPWRVLLLLAGAALVALLQLQLRVLALAPPDQDGVAARVTAVAPLVLPLLLLTATRRSPLRLATADASWLLTAPGGGRAVLARHLLAGPARFSLMVLAAGLLSCWGAGLDPALAWQPAAACAVLLLLLRLATCARHLLALGPAATLRCTRAVGTVWGMAMLASYLSGSPAAAWVRLAPLAQGLMGVVFEPAAGAASPLLAALASLVLAAGLLVAVAGGYQEPADSAAREAAGAREVLRHSASGQELGAERFRSGVASLGHRPAFAAERAVFYRALAQERRAIADRLAMPAVLLAVVAGLLVAVPGYGWVPLLLAVPHLLGEHLVGGLAVEHDHDFVPLTGMRRERVLLWANAVPVVRTAAVLEALWLPQILSPAVTVDLWWTGVLLAPVAAVLIAGASDLAGALVAPMAARFMLALGLCALGWVPCVALVAAQAPVAAMGSLSLVTAAVCGGAGWLERCQRGAGW